MVKLTTSDQIEHYRQHGWVKIPGLFTPDEVAEATQRVEAFIQGGAQELQGRHINRVEGEINSIHRLQDDRWIDQVLHSEEMLVFARQFLDDDAEPRKCELFAKPALVGLPSPAHQDNFLFCIVGGNAITVWVALDPAGDDNGALYYYDGSHSSGVLPHVKSFAPGTSQRLSDDVDLSEFERVVPKLERGDALVHHSEIIHGSEANTSPQSRRGWTLQYKGRSSQYDEVRIAQYEADLAEQLAARGQTE